jgi:hypothetical protein
MCAAYYDTNSDTVALIDDQGKAWAYDRVVSSMHRPSRQPHEHIRDLHATACSRREIPMKGSTLPRRDARRRCAGGATASRTANGEFTCHHSKHHLGIALAILTRRKSVAFQMTIR